LDVDNPELRRSYFRAPLTRQHRHVYPKLGPASNGRASPAVSDRAESGLDPATVGDKDESPLLPPHEINNAALKAVATTTLSGFMKSDLLNALNRSS
jgi:hypothetical protein